MDMIKLTPPEGVTSVSFDGQQYDADSNGHIEVPAAAALNFYAMGFGNAPAGEAAPAKAKKAAAKADTEA